MLIDCHNDTLYRMYFEGENFFSNNLHVSVENQLGIKALLFYAVFIDPEKTDGSVDTYFYNLYNNFSAELLKNERYISLIKNKFDLHEFEKSPKNGAVLTLEGGEFIDSLDKVDILKKLNIKAVNLTWNNSNKIAAAQMSGDVGGLTEFGYSVIDKMTENDIIVDLSHISDEAFYDVLDYVKKPVLVSHSNARAVCNFPRNITDNMFRRLIKNGGVVGINFCRDFLGAKADISAIIKHINHFLALGGENNIAFGSDFDGIPSLPDGISGFSSYPKIIEEMLKNNISEAVVNKITHKNIINLLEKY